MLPHNPFYNSLYMDITYPIIPGENPKRFSLKCPLSYFENLGSIKFGPIIFLATARCSICAFVKKVAGTGIPSKILKPVVIANTVIVARLKSIWTLADKCSKNSLVDINHNHIISDRYHFEEWYGARKNKRRTKGI